MLHSFFFVLWFLRGTHGMFWRVKVFLSRVYFGGWLGYCVLYIPETLPLTWSFFPVLPRSKDSVSCPVLSIFSAMFCVMIYSLSPSWRRIIITTCIVLFNTSYKLLYIIIEYYSFKYDNVYYWIVYSTWGLFIEDPHNNWCFVHWRD